MHRIFWRRGHGAMAVSLVSGTMQKMLENTARYFTARLLPVLLLAVLTPMANAASSVPPALACQSTTLNDERAEAVCTLPDSLAGKDVRFKAHFLGSHDDSKVSFRSVMLSETPVTCRTGSKTASRFEDGEGPWTAASPHLRLRPASRSAFPCITQQLDKTELVVD